MVWRTIGGYALLSLLFFGGGSIPVVVLIKKAGTSSLGDSSALWKKTLHCNSNNITCDKQYGDLTKLVIDEACNKANYLICDNNLSDPACLSIVCNEQSNESKERFEIDAAFGLYLFCLPQALQHRLRHLK